LANDRFSADFIRDNLRIQLNTIDAAHRNGASRFLFLGSSCIYPKHAPQPISEDSLLTGPLEPTNSAYAIAKIAGKEMCDAYRKQFGWNAFTVMPCNVYGIGDNYHPENSHVAAGLIRRFHLAKVQGAPNVTIWGTGTPLREFIYSEDLADASVFLMENYSAGGMINAGSGQEISIGDLAAKVKQVVGYEGELLLDPDKPDGTPRKLMDNSRLFAMGWRPATDLDRGLAEAYRWYVENRAEAEA
jgi:GDP-L-fucose synthase